MQDKIIYPQLSYQIMGVLFEVHNQIGSRFQEKYYQRAVALGFNKAGLKYQKELKVNLAFNDHIIGKYFLDFLVEDKIIVELKTVPRLTRRGIKQILAYLKAKKLKLGILVNFRTLPKLHYIRIINADIK